MSILDGLCWAALGAFVAFEAFTAARNVRAEERPSAQIYAEGLFDCRFSLGALICHRLPEPRLPHKATLLAHCWCAP